jgi:NADH-quinone oxidoreductase subunit E
MLSSDERAEIDAELHHYPIKRAVCVDAMKIVQKHRGWVNDEAMQAIADYLDMSLADLDGVATFFNGIFRRPVGRHVIRHCDSVSCWILGADSVRDALLKETGTRYGEISADGAFTVLPTQCLGACDRACVMMVGEDTLFDVDADGVPALLARYRSLPRGVSPDAASKAGES